jgi:2-oxo-4-hydroxy-4-carboxy-5-ureidoimidazoline decarboxylase
MVYLVYYYPLSILYIRISTEPPKSAPSSCSWFIQRFHVVNHLDIFRNMEAKPSVRDLLAQPTSDIIAFLGAIYEHSPWVAEQLTLSQEVYSNIASVTQLASAMKRIVDESPNEVKHTLLCAHPDLCEKVGTLEKLTKDSQEEQSRSGLQSLTVEELEQFTKYNTEYRSKFGFPFILAVRNATKYTVLSALRGRVTNTVPQECVTALQQVHKIAWMRLLAKLDTSDAQGFLTCHVLDTANGCPGTLLHIRQNLCVCSLIHALVHCLVETSGWYENSIASAFRSVERTP